MAAEITLAWENTSDRTYHIDEVNKNENKIFQCRTCNNILIPVKSEAKKKDWHFRHYVTTDCRGAMDKELHDYAVQILLESNQVDITKKLKLNYTDPKHEQWVFDYRSDVTVKFNNADVHFEIYVTNDLKNEKEQSYKTNKIKCVKIDLSDRQLRKASAEKIREEVLKNTKNKSLIFWGEEIQKSKESIDDPNDGCLLGILFTVFTLGFFAYKNSTPKFKRRRRR